MAVLAGTAFSVATLVSASSEAPAPSRAPAPVAALESPTADDAVLATPADAVLKRFAVFRDAVAAAQTGPTERGPLDGQPATIVKIAQLRGKRQVRASASSTSVCVLYLPRGAEGPGGACDDADVAARRGIFTSTVYADDDVEVAGIVPDGVRSVAFTAPGGDTKEFPVASNGFAATLGFPPAVLEFSTPTADVRQVLSENQR